jgi:alkanesulfonate monooxygenase SsuD/methylene tetrahydromethanopterin reductase-like flavin-dependent oxidoreductase (luciferase family)
VASQVATVDQLSGGRAVLGVGVGALDAALPQTGEESDLRTRAEMMDEGIDLIRTLWSGATSFKGRHYQCEVPGGEVLAVQERIPIWVVGVWPRPKSMRRVLRCDGVIPGYAGGPTAVREMCAWLAEQGAPPGFDVLAEGETPASEAAAVVAPWADAGCTWWMETRWGKPAEIRDRITAGP